MPCFYETLRIARRASLEEIKLAFKKVALEVHPDKGGNKEAFHQACGGTRGRVLSLVSRGSSDLHSGKHIDACIDVEHLQPERAEVDSLAGLPSL